MQSHSQHPRTIMAQDHNRPCSDNQCGSSLTQRVHAPVHLVWSMVRNFANPQAYKQFIRSCTMRAGNGGVGSIREVELVSGLPAESSIEQLEELDDARHVIVFSIIGGDHKLANYKSVLTLHSEGDGQTVVTESYVVDVPPELSKEDTCKFADTIVRCNLESLGRIAKSLASTP